MRNVGIIQLHVLMLGSEVEFYPPFDKCDLCSDVNRNTIASLMLRY